MLIYEPENECFLTNAQLEILKEREEKYLKGESKPQTLEEFIRSMNEKYGFTHNH